MQAISKRLCVALILFAGIAAPANATVGMIALDACKNAFDAEMDAGDKVHAAHKKGIAVSKRLVPEMRKMLRPGNFKRMGGKARIELLNREIANAWLPYALAEKTRAEKVLATIYCVLQQRSH